jgi:hypothetical protein
MTSFLLLFIVVNYAATLQYVHGIVQYHLYSMFLLY